MPWARDQAWSTNQFHEQIRRVIEESGADVHLALSGTPLTSTAFAIDYDDACLDPEGLVVIVQRQVPIFGDGFESGDTSAWLSLP